MAEEEKTEIKEESKVEEKTETTEQAKEEVKEVKKKKEEKKEDLPGIAYITATPNNTMVHITDLAGNTISKISGGMVTKHSRLKANPTIAMFVAKRVAERAKDLGITSLYVRTRGKSSTGDTGPGAHAAIKSLGKEGFRIINILDASRVPRGGPKKKGGKRGRRV
jgi:small subunit ribosomal protein S11